LTSLHSQLIYISEKSTNLPEAIFNISKILEKEIKQLLNNLTKLIEPLIIIFLGLWLGITILLIFSPIFQLIQNLSYN
jgi:type IV pilus assembly protein PilC